MKLKDKFMKIIFYGGLEKKDYEAVQEILAKKNSRLLVFTGVICVVLFLSMFLSTFISSKSDSMEELRLRSRLIYAFMILVCGITAIVGVRQKHHKNCVIITEWYLFLSILFGFAIWAGTYNQPYFPSTTFFVFLFALPFLLIECPIRLFTYLIGVSAVFLFCSSQTKVPDLFELDFLNSLCFLYLSISFSIIMMVIKYKEVFQKVKIEEQRDRDDLTGLLNKAAIEREVCKCLNEKEKGYLCIIDIDDFKHINDQYGHLFGDVVISAFGKSFEEVFGASSLVGRFGGDEFVLFMKEESANHLSQWIEKVNKKMETMINFPIQGEKYPTLSVGAAFFNGEEHDYKELLELADQALYEVKHGGKNQIRISSY